MKRITAGLIVLAGLLTCRAATYYVATNGVDTRTGLDYWTNAVATISNAAANANKTAGNVILVSNGTYNMTVQVTLSNGVTCRGFSGDPRDVIVDGSAMCRCFYISNAVLSAVTVTNGDPGAGIDGGGIYCEAAGAVSNCIITGNIGRIGGGVYCLGTVSDCSIVGNRAARANSQGGGAYIGGNSQFRRNIVRGNYSEGNSGGLYLQTGSSPMIADCTIAQNMATNNQGGGIRDNGSSSRIVNCWIISNVMATSGGVLGYGGGLYLTSASSSTYSNCVFAYNINSNNAGCNGGGVWGGSARFYNCLFYNNQAPNGAGAFITTGNSYWYNCTFSRNSAGSYGGGTYFAVGQVLINCIIYGNQSSSSSNYYFEGGAVPVFSNCCAAPSLASYGTGNIDTNPLFKASADNNFRLADASPCINTGLNQEWMSGAADLDGHSRIDYFKRQVDMGAYEYIPGGTMIMGR